MFWQERTTLEDYEKIKWERSKKEYKEKKRRFGGRKNFSEFSQLVVITIVRSRKQFKQMKFKTSSSYQHSSWVIINNM